MQIIDRPIKIERSVYDKTIKKIVSDLSKEKCVLSLYQLGNVKHPGISDIDLLVIFRDKFIYKGDPLKNLTANERYLFPHRLFGIKNKFLTLSMDFSFFSNYKYLYGEKISTTNKLNDKDKTILKNQIAMEYLIKNYIGLTVQIEYKILKLRALLLEANAVKFDLEFLNIKNQKINQLVDELVLFRENWFDSKIRDQKLIQWFNDYYLSLEKLIKDRLSQDTFFLNHGQNFQFYRNIKIINSKKIFYTRSGYNLPLKSIFRNKKYFNLNNRFNFFEFYFPYTSIKSSSILHQKKSYDIDVTTSNRKCIPNFDPLKSSVF